MLEVAVRHRFEGFTLDAAFGAPAGVTCVFGRSGAGKTSIVRAVAGLLKADEAAVSVDGERLDRLAVHQRGIGYVFQEPRLFPHLSVRGNLGYARSGMDPGPVVEMLGIDHLLDRRPAALSGGEAQRVAIGRALLSRPRMLLLDEPLAALDEARKAEILPYLERVRDAAEVPILYVSHSVAEVARLATTLVALEDGKVVRVGPASELLSDPDIAPVIGIREAGAVLSARVVGHHEDGLTELATAGGKLWLPRIDAPKDTHLRVRIEAQDVMLAATQPQDISALNVLPVRVTALREGQGPGVMVQLAVGSDHLLARVTHRSARAMRLAEGWNGYAVLKSVAVASGNIGQ
jgi:molybdate transport system ATP-binding protein